MMKINNTTIFFKGEQRFLCDEKQKTTEWTQSGWITSVNNIFWSQQRMGAKLKKRILVDLLNTPTNMHM